jgi:alcohol dehydrogenase class IV
MGFEFSTAARIFFGPGALRSLEQVIPEMGERCFVLTGGGSVVIDPLNAILKQAGVLSETFQIMGEPDVPSIEKGLEKARSFGPDFVVGFGGGSVIDAAKAIAALKTNPGCLMDYLEVIGRGQKIKNPPLPMIAIPTTAGTGSEVTRNAVIASPENQVKVSIRSPLMIPQVAIVDPELTVSMPPSLTASTGMDALTQVIEAYVSNRANPMTDIIAREGILLGARSLPRVFDNGRDITSREDMALCSLFGGLALANGGLGAVHGFAGPIGGLFNAAHGEICASLLPYVVKANITALNRLESGDDIKRRYIDIARMLTGNPDAEINDGVVWLEGLLDRLEIPGLSAMGVERAEFGNIIAKAKASSSMQKNPIKLEDAELFAILEAAY